LSESNIEQEGLNEITSEEDECKHHWMIPPPRGRTSMGQCRNCNERRDFTNEPMTLSEVRMAKARLAKEKKEK